MFLKPDLQQGRINQVEACMCDPCKACAVQPTMDSVGMQHISMGYGGPFLNNSDMMTHMNMARIIAEQHDINLMGAVESYLRWQPICFRAEEQPGAWLIQTCMQAHHHADDFLAKIDRKLASRPLTPR